MLNNRLSKCSDFTLLASSIGLMVVLAMPVSAKPSKPQSANLISIAVKQAEVSELFEMLSRQNHLNILLAEGVEGEVSVNLYNISVKDAIYAIASAANLAVEQMHNGYLITKHSNVGKFIAGGLTDVRTYKVQYTDTKKIAEILKQHLSEYGKIDLLDERKILVIEDKPEFLDRIERLLDRIDQAPAQILISARILKIDLNDDQRYGIDWTKTFTAKDGKGSVGVQNLGNQLLDLAVSAAHPAGFFFNYLSDKIQVELNLLSSKNRVHTLSSPSLLALEHQEAQVIIGDRTGFRVTTTINQVTTESVEFIESGVILKVTPYIDRLGRIMMEIHPEVSATTLNDGIPSLSTTEVHTRLLVEDGQTVFIGGLIRNGLSNSHQGIPVLEDIPLLGYLFSKEDALANNTETVVMIKPQIIRTANTHLLNSPREKLDQFREKSINKTKEIDDYFNNNLFHGPTILKGSPAK